MIVYSHSETKEVKDAFTVIANAKTFAYEGAKEVIPQFWQEHFQEGKGAVVCGYYGINIDEKMGYEIYFSYKKLK